MPEQASGNADLESALENLEDNTLNTHLARCQNYQAVKLTLESGCEVPEALLVRVLQVCSHDLKENLKYAVNALNLINAVLAQIKAKKCSIVPELATSAISVLHLLKTTALISKAQALQTLSFETFLSYPDETLVTMVNIDDSLIFELFDLTVQCLSSNLRVMPFTILSKVLDALPPEKRTKFVQKGLTTWFTKVIPTMMMLYANNPLSPVILVEVMEKLTVDLVKIDYADNVHWLQIIDNICIQQKYPTIMKNLLKSGCDIWWRLWTIYIRLLKHQSTWNKNKQGSPINSILTIVETAFKMDVQNRCRAFKCWDVLIDNFSSESNESFINKRVKLLVIPMKSNNAKIEAVALSKFETWWHLILKFQSRMDQLMNLVFIPYLHFCFGNPKYTGDKSVIIPGQLTLKLQKLCVQTYVNVVGDYCNECLTNSIGKLNKKILNNKVLSNNIIEWMHSLKVVMVTCGSPDYYSVEAKQQVRCIWKSFLAALAGCEAKRSVFNNLLNVISDIVLASKTQGVQEMCFEILTFSLFQLTEIKELIYLHDEMRNPPLLLHRILNILFSFSFTRFFNSNETEAMVSKLKTLTDSIVENRLNVTEDVMEWLSDNMPVNDTGLVFWTAVMESLNESSCDLNGNTLKNMLLWPLRNMGSFRNANYSAPVWHMSYVRAKSKLNKMGVDKDISIILLANNKETEATNQFSLHAILQIIKDIIGSQKSADCEIEAEYLMTTLSKVKSYENIKTLFPVIVECINCMLSKAVKDKNDSLVKLALTTAGTTLKLLGQAHTSLSTETDTYATQVEKLMKQISETYKDDTYLKHKLLIVDQLMLCATSFSNNQSIMELNNSILSKFLENELDTSLGDSIKSVLTPKDGDKSKANFTAPGSVSKRRRKKEANIVNTVIENGEEYVVVKSNWKFNPKKLTENQKEKLSRKREDIPALYQDLSQSQEEFKLNAWKTDSQDATNTSSMSSKSVSVAGNPEASVLLKQMSSTEVIPKIMENIFADAIKPEAESKAKQPDENTNSEVKTPKSVKVKTLTPKQTKSPRIALKDRVFQNMKNLIEKSLSPDRKAVKENLNMTMANEVVKTPVAKEAVEPASVNSAPPKLSADRPSRVKRKPRKFETDFQEIALIKKRRQSSGTSDSPSNSDEIECKQQEIETSTNTTEQNPVEEKEKSDEQENVELTKIDDDGEKLDATSKPTEQKDMTSAPPTPVKFSEAIINLNAKSDNEGIKTKESVIISSSSENLTHEEVKTPAKKIPEKVKASSTKKSTSKKSKIEKELAIDMVEGHPFLRGKTEKRSIRKNVLETSTGSRRKALSEKLKETQSDSKIETKSQRKLEFQKSKSLDGKKDPIVKELFTVKETQDNFSSSTTDSMPMSEDFIESSQDSSITTISVTSAKKSGKKNAKITLDNLKGLTNSNKKTDTQSLVNNHDTSTDILINDDDSKDDIEFSRNKSVTQDIKETTNIEDLTEEMDTEPFQKEIKESDDVIILDDDPVVEVCLVSDTTSDDTQNTANADTQNTATADTQLMDPNYFNQDNQAKDSEKMDVDTSKPTENEVEINQPTSSTADNDIIIIPEIETDVSSPMKDNEQRKQDFLNDTLEISPIKTMSPVRENNKSPSPEMSNDFVVIRLSPPVQINGEAYDNSGSPEVFTEDKISPDKRNQSPPREEANITAGSPSLSLKKNRPQVRQGGRAAQMLGLCVPDRLQSLKNSERQEPIEQETKKTMMSTPARRNLRILYNCENSSDPSTETDESETFLKFRKDLPSADCSPAGPILKRKLADIADETTMSPASKRKRVSFHDPPVSTTVSVQKYIEPLGVRSPQSSLAKRQERQTRSQASNKSPKKLENMFNKLETVLSKTVEEFTTSLTTQNDDTTLSSLEQTPSVEVVMTTDLNDSDPIYPVLVNSKDPISNIASQLSSPAMKALLIKELEGKIETVGDLAKLTELEVNRLCIKAPKVSVAKKVLAEYAAKIKGQKIQTNIVVQTVVRCDEEAEYLNKNKELNVSNIEIQTEEVVSNDSEMQTDVLSVAVVHTQTNACVTSHCLVQTDETGNKTTKDLVKESLLERTDFVNELSTQLDVASKEKIAEKLPLQNLLPILSSKLTNKKSYKTTLDSVLDKMDRENMDSRTYIQDYILLKYSTNDLILFTSELLKKAHDNAT